MKANPKTPRYNPSLDAEELRSLKRPPRRDRIVDGRFRKGPVPRDTAPAAQRRRAVRRWHGNGRSWTIRTKIPRRNRKLVGLALSGWSVRRIGRFVGVSKSHVHRIVTVTCRYRDGRWERVSHASVYRQSSCQNRRSSTPEWRATGTGARRQPGASRRQPRNLYFRAAATAFRPSPLME